MRLTIAMPSGLEGSRIGFVTSLGIRLFGGEKPLASRGCKASSRPIDPLRSFQKGCRRRGSAPVRRCNPWRKLKKPLASVRGADDYDFLNALAETEKRISTAIRDLIARGRVLLALDRYREGKASLSRAAEVAGVSISEMLDLLVETDSSSDLQVEDYRESLGRLRRSGEGHASYPLSGLPEAPAAERIPESTRRRREGTP